MLIIHDPLIAFTLNTRGQEGQVQPEDQQVPR